MKLFKSDDLEGVSEVINMLLTYSMTTQFNELRTTMRIFIEYSFGEFHEDMQLGVLVVCCLQESKLDKSLRNILIE